MEMKKFLLDVPETVVAEVDRIIVDHEKQLAAPLVSPKPLSVPEATRYLEEERSLRARRYPTSRPGVLRMLLLIGLEHLQCKNGHKKS